jgi:Dolichyl-phosphate-mannose-protein mannosyltransferase
MISLIQSLLKSRTLKISKTQWGLIAITLAALLIRLWGTNFGLPYGFHTDEHFYYPYAWSMGQGQLTLPDQSHGPSLYLLVLLMGQWIVKAISFPHLSPTDFGALIDTNPWPFLISARVISAVAGALTIPFVFWLGRRYRNERTGLLAAALMAILFFYVRDSHFGVPDSFMTLFVAAAGWLALRSYQTGSKRDFWLAGLAAGLATAAKYTSAFIFIPIMIAALHAPRNTRHLLLRLLTPVFGLAIGFVIGYPNILINFPAFIKDISFLWVRVGAGYEGWSIMPDNSAIYYLNTLLWGIGLPMMILAAIGLIASIKRHQAVDWIMLSFPISYFLAMSASRGHFGRYMIPLLPWLCVYAIDAGRRVLPGLWIRITNRITAKPDRFSALIGSIALAIIFIPNLAQSIRLDWLLSQPDTRTLAKEWIESNIAEGSRIAVEWPFHTPPLSNGADVPPNSKHDYWIDLVWGFGLADRPIEQYQTDGTQYLISTSYIQDIPTADPQQQAAREKFYMQLPQAFREIKTFSPRCDGGEPDFVFDQIYGPAVGLWQACSAGPLIRIYQVP